MKLKELRKEQKLTQEELAEKLFMTQTCYSSYETGRTEPDIQTLCKIADFFHVTIDYLVDREDNKESNYLTTEQMNILYVVKKLDSENLNKLLTTALKLLDNQK